MPSPVVERAYAPAAGHPFIAATENEVVKRPDLSPLPQDHSRSLGKQLNRNEFGDVTPGALQLQQAIIQLCMARKGISAILAMMT